MRLPSIVALACLFLAGPALAQECIEDPPPPKQGCTGFDAYYKACPHEKRVGQFCADEPLQAHIDCHPSGKLGSSYLCELLPVEVSPAGFLGHSMRVTVNSSTTITGTDQVTFTCQNDEPIVVEGTVYNGSFTDDVTIVHRCSYGQPPGYVSSWTVACAAGLPGYNEVRITPPVDGGATYYVVDLKSVRYGNGGWQRASSGASTTQLIRPSTESYVRVAACNSAGCGPYHDMGPRASPSLSCY